MNQLTNLELTVQSKCCQNVIGDIKITSVLQAQTLSIKNGVFLSQLYTFDTRSFNQNTHCI